MTSKTTTKPAAHAHAQVHTPSPSVFDEGVPVEGVTLANAAVFADLPPVNTKPRITFMEMRTASGSKITKTRKGFRINFSEKDGRAFADSIRAKKS